MIPALFPKRGMPRVSPPVQTRTTRDDLMGGWSIVRGTDVPNFQGTGNEVRLAGWERHPVVNACVRAIADIAAAVPLEVYRLTSDSEAIVLDTHPARDVLTAPRASLSPYRMMARTAVGILLYGNAFWHLARRGARGLPIGIRVVAPERIQYAWTDAGDDIVAYDWRDANGGTHSNTPVADMVHFRDLDARDGLFGYPRGASALLDIDSDSSASQYVRQMLKNHGVPGMVIMTEPGASIDDLRAAESAWHEKMTARGERGRTKFVAGVTDVKAIGFDLAQLEFPDLRRVAREDICAAFNVDPRIIGVASASSDGGLSGEQYREARFRLIQQSVMPLMKAIESELNLWFAPEFGDVFVRFSPDGLAELTENEGETSTRMIAEVGAGIRTVEEARSTLGMDADADPAHTLMIGSVKPVVVSERFDAAKQAMDLAKQAADAPPPDPNAQPAAVTARALVELGERRERAHETRSAELLALVARQEHHAPMITPEIHLPESIRIPAPEITVHTTVTPPPDTDEKSITWVHNDAGKVIGARITRIPALEA